MRSQESSSSLPRNRDRRGVACVEFAVVALPLLLLTLGAIDIGQYVNASQAVTNAARVGCRLAAMYPSDSEADVRTAVLKYLEGCYPGKRASIDAALTVTTDAWQEPLIPDPNTPNKSCSLALVNTDLPVGWQKKVKVEVKFGFDSVRWLKTPLNSWNAAGKELSSKTIMRRG